MPQYVATDFASNNYRGETESLRSITEIESNVVKQLSHQYHKILSLRNTKEELASSLSLHTVRSQYYHLLDETESNIQFIASGQGNIGRSEAEPNIILYGRNQLDVGRGQVQ